MTKKAMKLLLVSQAKAALWFLCIYPLVVALLLVIFHYAKNSDFDWVSISAIYSPKIYLLVMGIVYPLVTTELYLSRGLTRKQYFWAFTGAISIISFVLLLPTLIADIYMGTITPLSVIINFIQMPLFFLLGWTAVIGFQFGKWYFALGGILSAVVCFQAINAMSVWLQLTQVAQLGISILLITAQIMLLPRVICNIAMKN